MWRKFPLTEMVMPSNKKPPWGPGPPASQAPPSSAEGGKSSRRQPCCCKWHLSATFRSVWCTWTLRKSDYPWETRNSTRAMPLLGFTNLVESAWMFSFLRCESFLLATMNLITEKGWLKMLSLSVNRWGFTDKSWLRHSKNTYFITDW